jgi:hypothetical protein
MSLFEHRSLYDLSWYDDNREDPGEFNARRRFLMDAGIATATEEKLFGVGTTYWFEPLMILYHGPLDPEGFNYSWLTNARRMEGHRNEWKSFVYLPKLFPKPAIWHFLAVREYNKRKPGTSPEPICLINTPNLTADVKRMYMRFRDLTDRKGPIYEPLTYLKEVLELNQRFVERAKDEKAKLERRARGS